MILPESKLPFKEKLSKNKRKYQILDGNNKILIDNVNSLQDAMYIEDACNNYQKMAFLLKECKNRLCGEAGYFKPPYTEKYSFIKEIDELLKEINYETN